MSSPLRTLFRHARTTPDTEARAAEAARIRLAGRDDATLEEVAALIVDPAPEVRRALAANEHAPAHANVRLARDADVEVRAALAEKIGRAMPRFAADPRVAVQVAVLDVAETLARDQVPRVRASLAEGLKDSPDAPAHVIAWLARDWEMGVAAPVLAHSPLLDDVDLAQMIPNGRPDARLAIARRATLAAVLADAIVATGDRPAIAALLANGSAEVADATLERLIDESRAVSDLQAALVARPTLPPRAAVKLASFVAGRALELLRARSDFEARTLAAIERVISARLATGPREEAPPQNHPGVAKARRLHAERRLDEDSIAQALDGGDYALVSESLALLARVPAPLVARIRAARSAKGMTALAWKAGLPMRSAVRLQLRFGGVAAGEVLNARGGFDFPMTREEMEWMLDFFRN